MWSPGAGQGWWQPETLQTQCRVGLWELRLTAQRSEGQGQMLAAGLWAPGLRSPGEKFLQSEDLKVFSSPSRAVPGAQTSPGKTLNAGGSHRTRSQGPSVDIKVS